MSAQASLRRRPPRTGRAGIPILFSLMLPLPLLLAAAAAPADAQDVLERPANLSGGWVGLPWALHFSLPHRFGGDAVTPAYTSVLGLPHGSAAGITWVPGPGTDEVEQFVRHAFMPLAGLNVTVAWNRTAESIDVEGGYARWLGPVRLLAAGRWFTEPLGAPSDRVAVAGGVVWHPLPGTAPLALAADVAAPVDLTEAESPAWSAGVQAGIPYTALTLSLHVTNAGSPTLQGSTLRTGSTRFGFEITAPVPAGYFVGQYPDRSDARSSVAEVPERAERAERAEEAADVVVEIRRYAYGPGRIEIEAGSVVEWVNRDAAVHTATAEDGAWDSGAIRTGESWRARFDRPGTYPYYCGPHPFMKGVVVVR